MSAPWSPPRPEIRNIFSSITALDSSSNNDGHYHSDRLEELAQEMAKTFDADKRAELAIQMQKVILDAGARLFLFAFANEYDL